MVSCAGCTQVSEKTSQLSGRDEYISRGTVTPMGRIAEY